MGHICECRDGIPEGHTTQNCLALEMRLYQSRLASDRSSNEILGTVLVSPDRGLPSVVSSGEHRAHTQPLSHVA